MRSVEIAIKVPSLNVPGGIPGIGDATAAHPRPPTRPAPRQPLHRAVADGDAAVIDWLLLADATTLERPEADLRPLQRAVVTGRLPLVERLLAAGADATVRTRDGRSLLSLAVETGDEAMARFFLKRGGDPAEVAATTGWTLLHQAVNADAPALVRLLLEAGVDPWTEAKDGRSAVDLARDQARWPILRMLLGNP